MANFTPSATWSWLTTNGRLALRYGTAPNELQFSNALPTQDSAEAGCAFAFTLEHAEFFWTFWHALEPLKYPDSGRFAAVIDAIACVCFIKLQGQKSWHFQTVSTNFRPVAGELVCLTGQQCTALALVLEPSEQSSLLLLLDNLISLSGKLVAGGLPILVLNNRLQPWQPRSLGAANLPKTA